MNFIEYMANVVADGFDFIDDEIGNYSNYESLNCDLCFEVCCDEEGTYYNDNEKCRKEVEDLMWDRQVYELFWQYCLGTIPYYRGPNVCDTKIRWLCYLIWDTYFHEFEAYYNKKKRLA